MSGQEWVQYQSLQLLLEGEEIHKAWGILSVVPSDHVRSESQSSKTKIFSLCSKLGGQIYQLGFIWLAQKLSSLSNIITQCQLDFP